MTTVLTEAAAQAATGPPVGGPVVVYSINPKFFVPCVVSLQSVLASVEASSTLARTPLHVEIFHDDTLTAEQVQVLEAMAAAARTPCTVRVRTFGVELPPLLCDAPQWNNIETVATLLLPSLLPGVRRALFLDADTLVVGDLAPLWSVDLLGRPCGCVKDYDEHSPNTGVIVYDVDEWNRRDLTAKCIDYVATHRTFHVDQEPFTAVPGAEFMPLDLKWNYHGVDTWMFARYGRNLPADDVRILHFNGPPRPWFQASPRRFAERWHRTLLASPVRQVPLAVHGIRDFLSFRVSAFEARLDRARGRWKGWLVPYLVVRRLRMLRHYLRYRLAVWWAEGGAAG